MSFDRTIDGWFKAQDAARLTACGETMAVVRKKALLRILACHDADRTGSMSPRPIFKPHPIGFAAVSD